MPIILLPGSREWYSTDSLSVTPSGKLSLRPSLSTFLDVNTSTGQASFSAGEQINFDPFSLSPSSFLTLTLLARSLPAGFVEGHKNKTDINNSGENDKKTVTTIEYNEKNHNKFQGKKEMTNVYKLIGKRNMAALMK